MCRSGFPVVILGLVLAGACSVPLYKVAPIPNSPASNVGPTITINSLDVTASALTNDDQAFERFEANLPLAGIVAVDVQITNRATERTKSLTFALADANGRTFPMLDAKTLLKRMMQFEGVRVYARRGQQETLAQLQAITLPKKFALAAQESRKGVLFFHTKQPVTSSSSFVLSVNGTAQPLRIPFPS
jgi:hypothetical protein